jgi:hypothetical protein
MTLSTVFAMRPNGSSLALGVALLFVNCTNVRTVQLGQESPPFGPFGPPYPLTELGTAQNPTLTADLLELYFTSYKVDNPSPDRHALWVTKRADVNQPFGKPELVPAVNSDNEDSAGAISADGLTFWFSSNRTPDSNGMDIYVSTRAHRNADWSEPILVAELSTPGNDLPRPVGNHGLQMPLASTSSGGYYQLKMATRNSLDSNWGAPVPIAELANPDMLRYDGFLTDDGTMLLFNDEAPEDIGMWGEIARSWRLSDHERFATPISVGEAINGPTRNRDPWLSADGTHFFFASDRTGTFMIYEADIANDR